MGQLEGQDAEYQLSQVLIAIDAKKIAGDDFLGKAVNEVLSDIKDSEKVDENKEICYPGERTLNTRKENLEKGIPVNEAIWDKIKSL